MRPFELNKKIVFFRDDLYDNKFLDVIFPS